MLQAVRFGILFIVLTSLSGLVAAQDDSASLGKPVVVNDTTVVFPTSLYTDTWAIAQWSVGQEMPEIIFDEPNNNEVAAEMVAGAGLVALSCDVAEADVCQILAADPTIQEPSEAFPFLRPDPSGFFASFEGELYFSEARDPADISAHHYQTILRLAYKGHEWKLTETGFLLPLYGRGIFVVNAQMVAFEDDNNTITYVDEAAKDVIIFGAGLLGSMTLTDTCASGIFQGGCSNSFEFGMYIPFDFPTESGQPILSWKMLLPRQSVVLTEHEDGGQQLFYIDPDQKTVPITAR